MERLLPLMLLVISVVGLMLVNDRYVWGNVAILWWVSSHLMVIFIIYAGKLLLDKD